jgi:hypothetical protein
MNAFLIDSTALVRLLPKPVMKPSDWEARRLATIKTYVRASVGLRPHLVSKVA